MQDWLAGNSPQVLDKKNEEKEKLSHMEG